MTDLPYASSKAGQSREKEIRDTLRRIGATAVGFMVDDDRDCVIAQFRLAGREVTVPVPVGAYALAWIKSNPRGPRTSVADHQRRARAQAEVAVWGVLADWIKAQAAMIVCGMMNTDTAFLPHIHTPDGRRLVEVIAANGQSLLPPPDLSKPNRTDMKGGEA